MKKQIWIILLLLAVVFRAVPAGAAAGEETHVVILATSDMHGNIWGWSYENDAETSNDGMARLYSYIRQVREENPLTFLIDAGDAIQGTVLTDRLANRNPDDPHPVIAAMNAMGYDAMTLGNHEFDVGVPGLLKILSTADFPVMGQNVLDGSGNRLTGSGWTIVERGGVRLAVIGVVTPYTQIPEDAGSDGGVTFEAASAAVKQAIAEIGGQADILMVSAHMGLFAQYDEAGGSDSAQRILDDNPEIDVLQVGHMHITVNEKQGNTVIGGVRDAAREIARFDLTLDADGNITDSDVTVIDMAGVEPDEELRAMPLIREMHEKARTLAGDEEEQEANKGNEKAEPLGVSSARFQPENEISGLPEGRLRDTAVMDLILQVELLYSGADVAACALFRDDADLPEGSIYEEDLLNIYPFDNTLYRVSVTGAELKAYMEWAAQGYNQWVPGDISISFDPEFPGYLLDLFAGVDYEVNLSKPKGQRIENVRFQGEPLRDDQVLTLAVNNFRYSAALKPLNLVSGTPEWQSAEPVQDMIREYIARSSPITPTVDGNWSITGADLGKDDPRRAELIAWINEGLLPVPYHESCNLADYEELAALAAANRE